MNSKLCFKILIIQSITSNVKQNICLTALLRPICLDLNSNLLKAKPSVLWKDCQVFKRYDRGMSFSIQKVTKLFIIFSLHPVQDTQQQQANTIMLKTDMFGTLFSPCYFTSVAKKHLQTKCWSVKLKGILLAQWMSPLLSLCCRKTWQELNLKIRGYCPLRGSWAEIQANVDQGHCKVRDERELILLLVFFSVQQDCGASAAEQTSTLAVPTGVWGAALTQHILSQEARSTLSPDVPSSTCCLASLYWDPLWTSPNQTPWAVSPETLSHGNKLNVWWHTTFVKRGDLWQEPHSPLLLAQQWGGTSDLSVDPHVSHWDRSKCSLDVIVGWSLRER